MFRTGFVGNLPDSVKEILLLHPAFDVTGCYFPEIADHHKKHKTTHNIPEFALKTLFEINDVLIFQKADLYTLEIISEALKLSMHIMIIDICDMPSWAIAELIKLQEEAQTVVRTKQIARYNPALQACNPLITHPLLIELKLLIPGTIDGTEKDTVTRTLLKMLDALLFICPGKIRKIHSVRHPVSISSTCFINARIEFDNGSVANLLSSGVTDQESFTIDIYQKNKLFKIDMVSYKLLSFKRSEKNNKINSTKLDYDDPGNQTFYNELESFFQAILNNSTSARELYKTFQLLELSRKITQKSGFSELV